MAISQDLVVLGWFVKVAIKSKAMRNQILSSIRLKMGNDRLSILRRCFNESKK